MFNYIKYFPFRSPREGQITAIEAVIKGFQRGQLVQLVRAPTGAGKSAIAIAVGGYIRNFMTDNFISVKRLVKTYSVQMEGNVLTTPNIRPMPLGKHIMQDEIALQINRILSAPGEPPLFSMASSVFIATPTTALQDQYFQEFPTLDIASLKGKRHYACGYNEQINASECHPTTIEVKRQCASSCPYGRAINQVKGAKIKVFNYHSLVRYLRFQNAHVSAPNTGIESNILIVDECHLFPKFLCDLFSVVINMNRITELCKGTDLQTDCETIVRCINEIECTADSRDIKFLSHLIRDVLYNDGRNSKASVNNLEDDQEDNSNGSLLSEEELYAYRLFLEISSEFFSEEKQHEPTHTISFDKESQVITFVCNSPRYGFEKICGFFSHILFMSATVSPSEFIRNLGLTPIQCGVFDMTPAIPLAYRPLVYVGSSKTNMKFDNKDVALENIATTIVKLATMHEDWRGIVHANSSTNVVALQQHIKRLVSKKVFERFLFHPRGDKAPYMEKFLRLEDSIIVSPSLAEGFDGKDDIARWQCIIKIPYLPRTAPDVVSHLREASGEKWYMLETASKLAQMYGRVNRHATDYGITYLLDGGWPGFKWRLKSENLLEEISPTLLEAINADTLFVYTEDLNLPLLPGHPEVLGKRVMTIDEKLTMY